MKGQVIYLKRWALGVILCLIVVQIVAQPVIAEEQARSPYRNHDSISAQFSKAEIGESFVVRISTFEGQSRFRFTRIVPQSPQCRVNSSDRDQPCVSSSFALFQGRQLTSVSRVLAANLRASAAIVGQTLRVHFYGRRGRRLYAAETRVGDAQSRPKLLLRQQPVSKLVQCGLSVSAASLPLSSAIAAPVFSPALELEIATEADSEFSAAAGENTFAEIQATLNAAESIYLSQLGVKYRLRNQHAFQNSAQDPYKATTASPLLGQFQSYSETHRQLGPSDVNHLFTGKDIEGSIVGLAFLGVVCADLSSSYGLSQRTNPVVQPLIFAHELGHNLGAQHDLNAQESVMSPVLNPQSILNNPAASRFSDFSVSEITSYILSNQSCFSNDAVPFSLRPRFVKRALSRKGVLTLNITDVQPQCTLKVMLRSGAGFFIVSKMKLKAKDLVKGVLKLSANDIKIDPTAIPQFSLQLVQECIGLQTEKSVESDGVVATSTRSGSIKTLDTLATQIFRKLKKVASLKKK